jgi:hypothetical protein
MRWEQVCKTALAFSASRGATLVQSPPGSASCLMLLPIRSTAEIVIERNNQAAGSWYVRLTPSRARPAVRPVYFPPVSTPEALSRALSEAWVVDRCMHCLPV